MKFYKKVALILAAVFTAASLFSCGSGAGGELNDVLYQKGDIKLQFRNGSFTVLQLTDMQGAVNKAKNLTYDPRTIDFFNKVLDDKKPDLVVITGDMFDNNSGTLEDLKESIKVCVTPMEERKIPWVFTLGNHDLEQVTLKHFCETKEELLALFTQYPYNLNYTHKDPDIAADTTALMVHGSDGKQPAYAIWTMDIGDFEKAKLNDQALGGYSYNKASDINWYYNTSKALEAKYGGKINGLMFQHIALNEYNDLRANKAKYSVVGEDNEPPCPAKFNTGLFTTMLARGDIKGFFVGHDHTNTYYGNYYGIMMGYTGSCGFDTYGFDNIKNGKNRLRGGRIFTLRESDLETFETEYVLASQYGIDVTTD